MLQALDFKVFGDLSVEHTRRLLKSSRLLRAEEGQCVFEPGQECADFLLIRSGVVRVEMLTAKGDKAVLYRLRSGEACVLTTATLLARRRYSALAVAETPVEAVAVGSAIFDDLLTASPSFRKHVFADHADRILDMVGALGAVLFETIDQRLARRLLQLSDLGPTIINTHSNLAGDIGTSREVVSRRLGAFASKGWLDLARGRIEVRDRAALSAVSRRTNDP